MWIIALFGACLGAFIDYRFYYNYDIQVYDWSGNNNHGVKPARGTSSAVNTPYGLYLDGLTVALPPNSQSSSTQMQSRDLRFKLLYRYLPGVQGTVPREILSLKNGSNIRLQLRQQSASEASSPTFELEYRVGGTTFIETSNASYSLSKANTGKWYFIRIQINSAESTTNLELCINGIVSLSASKSGSFDNDWSTNYLGGVNTRAILYFLQIYSSLSSAYCSSTGYQSANGSPCSYMCPSVDYLSPDTDGVTLDYEGDDCASSCHNYGCVQDSPLTCWTDSCPPTARTDAACEACYPNTRDNSSDKAEHAPECKCNAGAYRALQYPLTCHRKL
jgi:hypothetical protein